MKPALLLLLLLPALQDDARARQLIEKLRSESVDERKEANHRLREMGKEAKAELERVASDPDVDFAGLVRHLLRGIALAEKLPARLIQAMPFVEYRLTSGDPHEWTVAFREACRLWLAKRGLERADVEALAAAGLKGAKGSEERLEICRLVLYYEFRAALPELPPLIDDPEVNVVNDAHNALLAMVTREDLPFVWEMTKSGVSNTASFGRMLLARMKVPEVLPLLKAGILDKHGEYSSWAVLRLGELGSPEAVAEILRILDGLELARAQKNVLLDNPLVFEAVFHALGGAGVREAIPRIAPYLKDPDGMVRGGAIDAMRFLDAREQGKGILDALDQPKLHLKAASALSALGVAEALPRLKELAGSDQEQAYEAVFEALVRLGGKDAVPVLVQAMQMKGEPHKYRRAAAARWICEAGSRESISYLLDQPYGYFWINALRKPELWERLRKIPLQGRMVSTEQRVAERLASQLGLPLEAPEGLLTAPRRGIDSRDRGRFPYALSELGGMLPHGGAEAILEEDRIRILSREDARRFWRDWAAK